MILRESTSATQHTANHLPQETFVSDSRVQLAPDDYEILESIQRRVLWLATLMIHHANHVRPNPDDLKIGGHQASSASMVSILTALYFQFLNGQDRVSVKPHASPAYHAIHYLLGNLDRSYLTRLREFQGLQAYPSRTKDPDPVDFSTGSVGLGAVAPAFAAVTQRYAQKHFGQVTASRFISIIGDAELDEGSVWEAVIDETVQDLDNVLLIVDLNRQSLDRVVPGIRAAHLKQMFAAAGWRVLEAKYGYQLREAFARPGGEALRRRIDEMSNEEYQSLIRRRGADLRARLVQPESLDVAEHAELTRALDAVPDDQLHTLLQNLGGHDLHSLLDVFAEADQHSGTPQVIFAYTIKGWGLPFAGEALNHSMQLTGQQVQELQAAWGIPDGHEWDAFAADSPEGRWCRAAAERLSRRDSEHGPLVAADSIPPTLNLTHPNSLSTQEALGRVLPKVAELPEVGQRVVTAAPDVATSTHLSSWVSKVGVFAPTERHDYQEDTLRILRWQPGPQGQHIELGISEINLFMLLGQLGLSYEICGQHLLPIGTVYDPFVLRGLDALIYGIYSGSRMIFVGTPSGVSLSPEGGAHQSTVTPSLGIELPDLHYYEPAFALEVEWLLLEALRQCCDRVNGRSSYLRLSTKKIDQRLLQPALDRFGVENLRRQVIQGGYRLVEGRDLVPGAAPHECIQIAVSGVMVPEAVEAARRLANEGIAANLLHLTSPRRLFAAWTEDGSQRRRSATAPTNLGQLATLLPPEERALPIVTVHDASAHSLAFLGSMYGAPVVPLGVNQFGQSGSMGDVYNAVGIGVDDIVAAGFVAYELNQGA